MQTFEDEKVDLKQKVLEHHMGLLSRQETAEKTQKLRVHNKVRRIGEKVGSLAELSMHEKTGSNLATMWSLLDSIKEDLEAAEVEIKSLYL